MATTVQPVVANSIGLVSRYVPIFDEKYVAESKTAIFDTSNEFVRFDTQAQTFYVFETEMVGLADYSRNDGFVRGDITSKWQPYAPQWDRGRQYMTDILDDRQALGMVMGTQQEVLMREHVVPETDALRIAEYANGAYSGNKKAETISNAAGAIEAIDYATATMDDEEVPYEGRILLVNPWFYKYIKGGITRMIENRDRDIDYNVERYNDMRVISVPSGRFNTQVTLNQPTAHDGAGDYTLTGSTINFMIVHPSAIVQANLFTEPRIFSPQQNQQAQAWLYDFRQYHMAHVRNQKKQGIYVSAPSIPSA